MILHRIATPLFVLLAAATSACTAETGNTEPTNENAPTSEALVTNDYTWSQGQPAVTMLHKNSGFCFLTRVSGKFEGWGEYVTINVAASGYFMLGGMSHQQAVTANARCVTWNEFGATGGTVSELGWVDSTQTHYDAENTSFCYLSGVAGQFDFGGGEYVSVNGGSNWSTTAHAQSGTGTHAETICMTMHDAANRPVYWKFGPVASTVQPQYVSNCVDQNGTASYCASATAMASSNGVCMLSKVGGKLLGAGEFTQVVRTSSGGWRLDVRSDNNLGGVLAASQCLYF